MKSTVKDIAIYGAGGFGREVACLIRMINESKETPEWNLVGFFDDNERLKDTSNEYGRIIGGREVLNAWPTPISVAVAIGSPKILRKIVEGIKNELVSFPNLIAPNTVWFDKENVTMGKGNIICPNSTMSCHLTLGDFNMLNAFTQLGHDMTMGNYNVLMPSVNISGGTVIGNCNLFGVGCALLQYFKVGDNTRVAPGSVVMRNTKNGLLYIGIPAKGIEI